jgi:hypothetical protein
MKNDAILPLHIHVSILFLSGLPSGIPTGYKPVYQAYFTLWKCKKDSPKELHILTNQISYDIIMLSHGMDAFRCGSGSDSAGQGLK